MMSETSLIPIFKSTSENRIAVVFIHGLGGDPFGTWQSTKDVDSFWPGWLANDLSGLSIYTIAYDASPSIWNGDALQINDRAVNIFECLALEEEFDNRQIVLVCHSLGGLVAKAMLRHADDRKDQRKEANQIINNVKAVVFLATRTWVPVMLICLMC